MLFITVLKLSIEEEELVNTVDSLKKPILKRWTEYMFNHIIQFISATLKWIDNITKKEDEL